MKRKNDIAQIEAELENKHIELPSTAELEEAYDERLRKYKHPDSPAVLGHGFI